MRENCKTMDSDEFNSTYSENTFTTVLSHGAQVLLCDNGSQKAVTQENCLEFTDLVLRARQDESKEQINELIKGVSTVLDDLSSLKLMEWH